MDKTDISIKSIFRDEAGHYIIIKGTIDKQYINSQIT